MRDWEDGVFIGLFSGRCYSRFSEVERSVEDGGLSRRDFLVMFIDGHLLRSMEREEDVHSFLHCLKEKKVLRSMLLASSISGVERTTFALGAEFYLVKMAFETGLW